jgi:hypothetical protein
MNTQSAPYMNQAPVNNPLPSSRNPNTAPIRDGTQVTEIPEVYSNSQGDGETPANSYPTELGSPVMSLPFQQEGPADFFPAVSLQTHWDPTMILKRTLPDGYVPQSTDPRPWTRICMEYTTAGEDSEAPDVNPNIVMPTGGEFYPASKYRAAIDDESKLRWLDRKLGTCEGNQWEPNEAGDMFNSRLLVPDRKIDPTKIQELAYPRALLRSGPYDCRAQNDAYAIQTSSDYIFNNATKQDRYKAMNKPVKPAAPSNPLKAAPEQLRPDLLLNAGPPRPQPIASPMVMVTSGSAEQKQQPVYQSGANGGVYRNMNGTYVFQQDNTPGFNYMPSDLASALAKSEQTRASAAGLAWDPTGATTNPVNTNVRSPDLSYGKAADSAATDLKLNAVDVTDKGKPVTLYDAMAKILTSPFSDNSPWAPF